MDVDHRKEGEFNNEEFNNIVIHNILIINSVWQDIEAHKAK